MVSTLKKFDSSLLSFQSWMRFVLIFWFLIILSYFYDFQSHPNIKSLKNHWKASRYQLLAPVIPLLPILLTGKIPSAIASELKGKLEYQPALQGLDYGKVEL